MSRARKYFVNRNVHFITSRMEEGLPMVPTHLLNTIIWGILARAREMYRVRICHFVFLANHFHMLALVDDPEGVPDFVGYVKAEISHAINKLLGRRKKTLWEAGYDSPALLTPEDVLRYISYIYLNPANAGLVDSIEQYPGVSSWEMFKNHKFSKTCPYIPRNRIQCLELPALSINEQKLFLGKYERAGLPSAEFILEPFAWMEAFSGMDASKIPKLRERTFDEIKTKEESLFSQRKKSHQRTIGPTALRRQSMRAEHVPEKHGNRMICICSRKDLRVMYIASFKGLCDKARAVYESWKAGDVREKIPIGLFSPRVPILAVSMPLTL